MKKEPVWSPQGSVFRTVRGNDDWFSQRKATGDGAGQGHASLCPSQGLSLLFDFTPGCWVQGLAYQELRGDLFEGIFWKPSLVWVLVQVPSSIAVTSLVSLSLWEGRCSG